MEEKIFEKLVLEDRKNLTITLVDAVDGFSEQNIFLMVNGARLKISGEKLKITNFNKSLKSFSCEGLINEVKYSGKKMPFLKRLFK